MYTVSGDEPLLVTEAVDALRASARGAGRTERLSMVMDARSDWSSVLAATQSVSLFGDRRILEIKIPTGKPGKAGADTLARLAEQAEGQSDADTLVLISLPRLDKATRESRWVQALARSGMMVDIASIERGRLPAWVDAAGAPEPARRQRHPAMDGRQGRRQPAGRPPGNPEAGPALSRRPAGRRRGARRAERGPLRCLRPARRHAGRRYCPHHPHDRRPARRGRSAALVLWAVGEEIRLLARASPRPARWARTPTA